MDSELLSDTFVDLADTMVADFDIIEFLHMLTDRSVALLAASAAGVVLADPRGELRVAAASSEAAGHGRSCSRSRTTRDRAWIASVLAAQSRPLTLPSRGHGGPGSPPPPLRLGSARSRPCRCDSVTRSSGR